MTTQLVQLRRIIDCLDGRRIPLNREERSEIQGKIPYWGAGGIVDSIDKHIFDEPLVLLGEDGAPFFALGKDVSFLIDGPSWVNNHIHVLRPQGVYPSYLRHALNVVDYGRHISGSTRDKLTQEDMGSIEIVLPDPDEQQRIADFLDAETTKLEDLVDRRRRYQALLDQRLTSSLVRSVLVNQNSWARTRLKYLFTSVRNGLWGEDATGGPEDLTCVRVADFLRDSYRADPAAPTRRSIPAVVARDRLLRRGDILLEKSGGGEQSPVGFAVMFDSDARSVCSNFVAALRVTEGVNPRFACLTLAAFYRSGRNFPYIKQATGIQNLDGGAYLAQEVQIPSQREQETIAARFDHELDRALGLHALIDRQIALITERRHALITAAVTGQIDVTTARGVSA